MKKIIIENQLFCFIIFFSVIIRIFLVEIPEIRCYNNEFTHFLRSEAGKRRSSSRNENGKQSNTILGH